MPDVVDWLRRGAAPLAFRAQAVQDVDYRLACCVAAPNHDDVNMGLPLLALLVMVDVVNCVSERNLEDSSQFMAANSEETIKELAVTEDQVKTLLELQTIQKKMYDPVVAEGKITVSDDEANQTTFTYVSISTSGDDITDEEKKTKKEQAQEILDKMKEDPTADMSEIAKGVDDSYSAVQGNFTTKESKDEDEDSGSEAYPGEVLKVLS